jgi:hypothetical protein
MGGSENPPKPPGVTMPSSRAAFPASDLIQLPRFDAAGALTLGKKLLRAASAEPKLPRAVKRALRDLEAREEALRAAVDARLAAVGAADPARVAAADCNLDASWTALFDWLTGFSKLPGGAPEAAEAVALLRELYPDGLSFILLPYELEWGQSDVRLARIGREALGERIEKLGGQPFLAALGKAHREYGEVLGLPHREGKGGAAAGLREALDAFTEALRVYALRVTAYVDVDEPETVKLSRALLKPLLTWKGGKAAKAEDESAA